MNFLINTPLNISPYTADIENVITGQLRTKSVFESSLVTGKEILNASGMNFNSNRGSTIGILNIEGVLTKSRSYYTVSYQEIASRIKEMEDNPEIIGIILMIHSPGGTADGNPIAAEAVKATKKPVVVLTSFCYSAAYLIASQANYIMLHKGAASGIGSIGTMFAYTDVSGNLEKAGVKLTLFRAEGSELKNLVNGVEPLSEETISRIQKKLNSCRTEFVGYVNRGRFGKVKNEALTGDEFGADEAFKFGLIDGVGNLDDAIKMVMKLAA